MRQERFEAGVVQRYSRVAMALHWSIALCILVLLAMGIWMSGAIRDPAHQATAYRAFQLHKSLGFLVLLLTLVRIGWRLSHRPPDLPAGMKAWETFLARATHAAFYAFMSLMPLSGWVYVSAGWASSSDRALKVATIWFGLFEIPHMPFIEALPAGMRRMIAFSAIDFHYWMAMGGVALLLLHVGAALKHQLIDRDTVLPAMVQWLNVPANAQLTMRARAWDVRPIVLGIGAIVAIALVPVAKDLMAGAGDVRDTGTAARERGGAGVETGVQPGRGTRWNVDEQHSTLAFSGTHAGAAFNGRFEKWRADIWFDPADLAGARIVILLETGSARMGDKTQEETLSEPEWFDVVKFPLARFDSSKISRLGDDRFEIAGTLRMKDRALPIHFPAVIRIDRSSAEATGTLVLDRTRLGLGMESDPAAQWVSAEIQVTFGLAARGH